MNPNSLLDDGIIGVTSSGRRKRLFSLPELLCEMGRDKNGDTVHSFTHLSPHQAHSWHAFLAQLGAIALHHAKTREFPDTADEWRDLLLALGHQRRHAWDLVVEDPTGPAFMQPPLMEGFQGTWREFAFPDEMDIIVNAANHEVKKERIHQPEPDHWLYSLVSAQTASGYSGRMWNGSIRMNGGYGSRMCVTLTPRLAWGPWWKRDVKALLEHRTRIARQYGYLEEGGIALTWLQPWDGKSQLEFGDMDPYFIESARRYRLTGDSPETIRAVGTGSAMRMTGKEKQGVVGDPWTPFTENEPPKSLTLGERGFTYRILCDLLFERDGWRLGPIAQLQPGDTGALSLVARGLLRGQGKTEQYFERTVPVPGSIPPLLRSPSDREIVAQWSEELLALIDTITDAVLKFGLWNYLAAADAHGAKPAKHKSFQALRIFDARVDDAFYPLLWKGVTLDGEDPQAYWCEELLAIAQEVFEEFLRSKPAPAMRRVAAAAVGTNAFNGAAQKLRRSLQSEVSHG